MSIPPVACPPRLPSPENPKDRCIFDFNPKRLKNTFMHDLVVYSDLETFCSPGVGKIGKSEVKCENRKVASAGCLAVGHNVLQEIPERFRHLLGLKLFHDLGDGKQPLKMCFRHLCEFGQFWEARRKEVAKMKMEEDDAWKRFRLTTKCEDCGKAFGNDRKNKVRDHDHVTGKYRAALCVRMSKFLHHYSGLRKHRKTQRFWSNPSIYLGF
jgi:hypothetical protein